MNVEFRDSIPNDGPRPQQILVDDKMVGEARPHGSRWYACVNLWAPSDVFLLHGFGDTPQLALADSITKERQLQVKRTDDFAAFQKSLGTDGVPDDQLK